MMKFRNIYNFQVKLIHKKQYNFTVSNASDTPQLQKQFTFKDFQEITKIKLALANTLVAIPAFIFTCPAGGFSILPFTLATQLMAMSTQTANQAIEIKYDKLMVRTCRRPLPLEKIQLFPAITLSMGLFISSNLILYNFFPIQGLIVANTIFFSYVGLYTPMKRLHSWNTLIGAIIGGLPVFMGWACGGGDLANIGMILAQFMYMVSWQFSHFYGILFRYKNDYENAGFQMLYDSNTATKHMKVSLALGVGSIFLFGNYLDFNQYYLSEISMSLALYKWGWIPLKEFHKNPGVESAKWLKINSYKHFMIFWILVYGDLVYKWLNKTDKQILNESQEKTE